MSTLARERSLPTPVILITHPDHNTSHFTKKWRKRYFVLYTPKEPYDKKNSMLMYFDDEISCQKVCVVRVSGWKGERVWTLPKDCECTTESPTSVLFEVLANRCHRHDMQGHLIIYHFNCPTSPIVFQKHKHGLFPGGGRWWSIGRHKEKDW